MSTHILVTSLILVLAATLSYAIPTFVNNFGQNAFFGCPAHQTISGIYSRYGVSATYRDRRYSFTCQTVSASPFSANIGSNQFVPLVGWQSLTTTFNFGFTRVCFQNGKLGVIVLFHSLYSTVFKDRRFLIGCRFFGQNGSTNYKRSHQFCEWKTLNCYRDYFAFDLPYDKYIFAIRSQFDSSATVRDRQFKAYVCPVVPY